MKKTYRTNNGENRSSFFRVGRKLVTVSFLPTFTTENPMVQAAIEKSIAFREGIQLVTSSMQWIKIDRDENGFATEECLDKIFSHLPVVLHHNKMGGGYDVLNPQTESLKLYFREGVKTSKTYTHYLPIPKF